MTDYIIEAKDLKKTFSLAAGFFSKRDKSVYAVNGLSLAIKRNTTYGLIGESGCGKTTTARILCSMYKPNSGTVVFYPKEGNPLELSKLNAQEKKLYRQKIKYVFQDPSRSLNPRMKVLDILTDAYKSSDFWPGKLAAREEACKILEETGLSADDILRRPSEFSGGQRQRISIARGLIMKPDLLICDEVVSALDVSIQAQILDLLCSLKESRNLSYLFIAHDLRVACYFCDTIGIMYRGVLVEEGPARYLYKEAQHPYTKLLFEGAISSLKGGGETVSLLEENKGCPFAHRCKYAKAQCKNELPPLREVASGQRLRCFL